MEDLTPAQAELYRIQSAVQAVHDDVLRKRADNPQAAADVDAALDSIIKAVGQALDAYARLQRERG